MCAIPEGSTLMTHSPPKTSPLTIILGIRFQHMKDWGGLGAQQFILWQLQCSSEGSMGWGQFESISSQGCRNKSLKRFICKMTVLTCKPLVKKFLTRGN